jgi:hypothetical protein
LDVWGAMDRSLAAGLLYSFTVGFLRSEKFYYLLNSEIKCRSLTRAANDNLFQIKLTANFIISLASLSRVRCYQ